MQTQNHNYPKQCADIIKKTRPDFHPKIGIILGSGLGGFTDQLTDISTINYQDLPGFPMPTVEGHKGKMILGKIANTDVICLQGRAHTYEGIGYEPVKTYIRTLKLLGCDYLLATNASGSLREDVSPGELMLITDHINFQIQNPLIGPNDDEFGPRFFAVDTAYNPDMRDLLLNVADQQKISLHQGVYISVMGPNYETAAEIRAFKLLGADAVGMSTVPEVLIANHCSMKVAVIATITNFATGLATTSHEHSEVVSVANRSAEKLSRLIMNFVKSLF